MCLSHFVDEVGARCGVCSLLGAVLLDGGLGEEETRLGEDAAGLHVR